MAAKVVILPRTPVIAKTVARCVQCAGAVPVVASSAEALEEALGDASLVCLDAGDAEPALPTLARHPEIQILLWVSSSTDALLPMLCQNTQLNHVFGLRYPDAPPRLWELVGVIHRWVAGKGPAYDGYLSWGGGCFEMAPATKRDLDAVVEEVVGFATPLVGDRMASGWGEVAHELLMNAMYDAPVNAEGEAVFAHDRTAQIQLTAHQQPRLVYGSDGARLLLSVTDPFGRLQREHVFGALNRAVSSGQLDRRGGGAGLGLMMIYRASTQIFFDVLPKLQTRVSAVLELDVPPRELRQLPRSIHFFKQVA
jgi:hypothetical protein